MDKHNLIIFKFKVFYEIMKELEKEINYNVFHVDNLETLNQKNSLNNCLIITSQKIESLKNQIVVDVHPIKFSKLIEKINIYFIKSEFSQKSEFIIGKYKIDLNSREIKKNSLILKLTEKETNIIVYLSNLSEPVSVDQLQSKVWGYQSKLETHTVETHVYRLRKKILKKFDDDSFIISKKNGYQIG